MLTFKFLCEYTIPKAGALALLQRTAARTQNREMSDPTAQQREGEKRTEGTEEKVAGVKLVDRVIPSQFGPLVFLLTHEVSFPVKGTATLSYQEVQ